MAKNIYRDGNYFNLCPHCFSATQRNEAKFIDYHDLGPKNYPEFVAFRKRFFYEEPDLSNAPLIFTPSQTINSEGFAAYTKSGDLTRYRACPVCYGKLPAAAGRMRTFVIPIICSNTNQTLLNMTYIFHNLMNDMRRNFGISVMPSDYDTALRVSKNLENKYFKEKRKLTDEELIAPYMFEFINNSAPATETHDKNNALIAYNRALIMFCDIDIEKFTKYPEFYGNVIAQADGILYLVDMPGTHTVDDKEILADPIMAFLHENYTAIFGTQKLNKPVATVFTNATMLKKYNDKFLQKALRLSATANPSLSYFPGGLYAKIDKAMTKHIRHRYTDFFVVLNRMTNPEYRRSFVMDNIPEKYSPGNVPRPEIPLLWLLAKMKVVPSIGKI